MKLNEFQPEVETWAKRNFGPLNWRNALMGISEEVGELNHALLKREQGIRGTYQEHTEAAQDAVGDIVVFLANFCSGMDWDLDDIVTKVWSQVQQRDWRQNKQNGLPNTSPPPDLPPALAATAPERAQLDLSHRSESEKRVKVALETLDGSRETQVQLLTGLSRQRIDELSGDQ